MLLVSFSFNQTIIFCIKTLALDLINQYSTGLFVSHSTRGKTQLCDNDTVSHQRQNAKLKMHQSENVSMLKQRALFLMTLCGSRS
jgi:hypothetical protein